MDQIAKAAFIISQAICAQAELDAMRAANLAAVGTIKQTHKRDEYGFVVETTSQPALPYTEEDIRAVPDKYSIGHNTVLEYLR